MTIIILIGCDENQNTKINCDIIIESIGKSLKTIWRDTMSAEKNEVSLLESLKQQHGQFIAQRDQAQINFQQLVGAIFACECIIKQYEESLKSKELEQGAPQDEQVVDQAEGQAA